MFRLAEIEDAKQIIALIISYCQEAGKEYGTPDPIKILDSFVSYLTADNQFCLLWDDDGLCGLCCVDLIHSIWDRPECHIKLFYVSPRKRRSRDILAFAQYIADFAKRKNPAKIIFSARFNEKVEPTKKLFESAGFKNSGIIMEL